MENGGPAPEGITDRIFENTKTIKEYLIAEDLPDVWYDALSIYTNFMLHRLYWLYPYLKIQVS